MSEEFDELLAFFERTRRKLVQTTGKGASGSEAEYSQAYDRLAQKGIGNRRRLRQKYRK